MPTEPGTKSRFREQFAHLKDELVVLPPVARDKHGAPLYDMLCPICRGHRGKLRMQAMLLPCKRCGQQGKCSPLKGKKRNDEFKRKVSLANLKRRRKSNPGYTPLSGIQKALAHNARTRLWQALNGINRCANTTTLIGCSVSELERHLEQRFHPNPRNGMSMTWDNLGRASTADNTWQVDHVRPLASFDLRDPEQQRIAFHYTNLQPLWAIDNLKKRDRYDKR